MLNNQIIILTDANTEIGFGHLNRCLSLKKNNPSKFQVLAISTFIKKNVIKINWLDIKNIIRKIKNKIVLIDYPKIKKKFIKKINIYAKKIILFYNGQTFKEIDYYININKIKNIDDKKQIVGSKYIIIDSLIKKIKIKKNYDYLVSLGQSKDNIRKNLIDCLRTLKLKIVVLSNKIPENISAKNIKFLKIKNKRNFNKIMNQCKLIVTSASQTAFEALYLNKKILVIKTSNNQNSNYSFLKEKKINCVNSFKSFNNKKKILKLLNTKSNNKKIFIDKLGPNRILNKLKNIIN